MKLSRFFYIPALIILILIPTSVYASNHKPPTVSSKEMRYFNNYIEVNMRIPMISFSNLNVEKRINTTLEGDVISFKNQIESSAKESFKESHNSSFEFIPYQAFETFKVTYITDKILSIPITFYNYTGGAHGLTIQQSYNFDLESGDELHLNELFVEDANYKSILINKIKNSIKQNPDIYFDDAASTIDKLSDNQDFYITNNNLVIYYPLYEIAPYSSGIREFPIPLSSISSVLNPKLHIIK